MSASGVSTLNARDIPGICVSEQLQAAVMVLCKKLLAVKELRSSAQVVVWQPHNPRQSQAISQPYIVPHLHHIAKLTIYPVSCAGNNSRRVIDLVHCYQSTP